ncbi:MAG TPA: TolC family protein [Thermoanaerobaculia bacterium]|nr:TolC family protein [Thermoanaerobaculia bacterium]
MIATSAARAALGLLLSIAALGCASADPRPAVESTAALVGSRGVVGLAEAHALDQEAAVARTRLLLAEPLTPAAAAETALLRSPRLRATLAELGVAQADLAQATRLANPGLSFERISGGGGRTTTVGLAADVVDWITQPLRRDLAEAEVERTKLEVGAAILQEIGRAKLALIRLQAAEAVVVRLGQVVEIDRAAADFAVALHAAGNVTALERANAEAGWAETRAELGVAQAEVASLREQVVLALGLDGAEAWSAAPLAGLPTAPPEPSVLEQRALAERLDLAAARWAVNAVERARRLRRATRWLPVGIEVGVEREKESLDGDDVRLTGPTIELALPIFDAGGASLARLDAELGRARAQLAAAEARARSEVRARSTALVSALELTSLYEQTLLPLRREVLARTLAEYNQMIVGTFEVLLAKQTEIEAERRAIEARAEAWAAATELELAVGAPLEVPFPSTAAEPSQETP